MPREPKTEAQEPKAQSLADLKELTAAAANADAEASGTEAGTKVLPKPQKDAQGRAYATGRRKNAVARVWIKPCAEAGKGRVTVNGRDQLEYFARPTLRMIIEQPFQIAARSGQFDVVCTVNGGGLSGQAGAVRHGISRALTLFEPELRPELKHAGMLTRDSRVVERKKYGRRKARRGMQWAKR